jgi:formate--tetrahydrofolate ligase
MLPITSLAERLALDSSAFETYGRYTAKLSLELLNRPPHGKLILVTAITPTSHGEGKTVTSIGLGQALCRQGRNALVTLRQPSLGPVFGLKGGATGGGKSQVLPADQINLHFTGDFHAVTSAHNLLAALLDSHLYHGNELDLDLDRISWPRTLDMNDRALRRVQLGLGGKLNGVPRESGFVITAASEVMAILALTSGPEDLRRRLGEIVVGFNRSGQPVRARELKAVGSMMLLLHDALRPNLVQTTEGTPALVHAGPFANIAHGTSSVISQRIALGLADYVINETGFAADLGAEKYFDIVMPESGLRPSAAVLIASVRAMAAQGCGDESAPVTRASLCAGMPHLKRHVDNVKRFGVPVVVAINRFHGDTPDQIAMIREACRGWAVEAHESDVFARGGEGALDLAEAVVRAAQKPSQPEPLYPASMPLTGKIQTVATTIYGASEVAFSPLAAERLQQFSDHGFGRLPVCMAKTQNSLSDNPKRFGVPEGYTFQVTDAHLSAGAGFVVAIAGNMMRMPGLGRDPQAFHLDVSPDGQPMGLH